MRLEAKIETAIKEMREQAQLDAEEKRLRDELEGNNVPPSQADAQSIRSHRSAVPSQRSKTSEKQSIHSITGRSVAASSARGITGVRHRYAVVHLDPAVKLNMTDDQWVQQVEKNMNEGAKMEMEKIQKRAKMLKDI